MNVPLAMPAPDLHMVCFDRPWPPGYGGIQDVHYRWKAWCEAGHQITMHTFDYGRQSQAPKPNWAKEVKLYKRSSFKKSGWGKQPYIVASRKSTALWKALSEDDAPIWLEGQHSTAWLPKLRKAFPNRCIVVRCHNIEADYYRGLAKNEHRLIPKFYFKWEAARLRSAEKILALASGLVVIRPGDLNHFEKYGRPVCLHYPGHPWKVEHNHSPFLPMALYHGDLTVIENQAAVRWLLSLPWTNDFPLWIAGRGANALAKKYPNKQVRWLEAPGNTELKQWMESCCVHVLPTNQNTGVKLKLLHALSTGRPILCNPPMVEGTGLEAFCHIKSSKEDWTKSLSEAREGRLQAIKPEALTNHPAFDPKRFEQAWDWLLGLE